MSNKNNELNFLSYLEDGKETTQKNISNNISVSIGFINALIKKNEALDEEIRLTKEFIAACDSKLVEDGVFS